MSSSFRYEKQPPRWGNRPSIRDDDELLNRLRLLRMERDSLRLEREAYQAYREEMDGAYKNCFAFRWFEDQDDGEYDDADDFDDIRRSHSYNDCNKREEQPYWPFGFAFAEVHNVPPPGRATVSNDRYNIAEFRNATPSLLDSEDTEGKNRWKLSRLICRANDERFQDDNRSISDSVWRGIRSVESREPDWDHRCSNPGYRNRSIPVHHHQAHVNRISNRHQQDDDECSSISYSTPRNKDRSKRQTTTRNQVPSSLVIPNTPSLPKFSSFNDDRDKVQRFSALTTGNPSKTVVVEPHVLKTELFRKPEVKKRNIPSQSSVSSKSKRSVHSRGTNSILETPSVSARSQRSSSVRSTRSKRTLSSRDTHRGSIRSASCNSRRSLSSRRPAPAILTKSSSNESGLDSLDAF